MRFSTSFYKSKRPRSSGFESAMAVPLVQNIKLPPQAPGTCGKMLILRSMNSSEHSLQRTIVAQSTSWSHLKSAECTQDSLTTATHTRLLLDAYVSSLRTPLCYQKLAGSALKVEGRLRHKNFSTTSALC